MKKIKYLSLITIMILILTGCGTTSDNKEKKEENKPIAVNPPLDPSYTGVKKIVYLDPTNLNKKCTENDVNSEDGTKSGCMKWYAYKEDDKSYTMILDHNTTNLANWILKSDYIEAGGDEANIKTYSDGRTAPGTDKGPVTAQKTLANDTVYWEKSLNTRLVKASEIKEITGNKTNFDEDKTSGSKSKYAWLYDRTDSQCEEYGCLNNATSKTADGYWTDTSEDWRVLYVSDAGTLAGWGTVSDVWCGIRPVITVSKDELTLVEENENNN